VFLEMLPHWLRIPYNTKYKIRSVAMQCALTIDLRVDVAQKVNWNSKHRNLTQYGG
jgi:hypothetical protein